MLCKVITYIFKAEDHWPFNESNKPLDFETLSVLLFEEVKLFVVGTSI